MVGFGIVVEIVVGVRVWILVGVRLWLVLWLWLGLVWHDICVLDILVVES